jgi:F0F1-type ATP synthase epsilon subunit
METPETEGFPPEEEDQEDTGADSAADAATLDQEEIEKREQEVDEQLEDRGDL